MGDLPLHQQIASEKGWRGQEKFEMWTLMAIVNISEEGG